jgi:hypothetical protein
MNIENSINISDCEISNLIKRKLDGDKLTSDEFIQLHNWMIKNDDNYSKSVDIQMKKDLKKYVPIGTKIK